MTADLEDYVLQDLYAWVDQIPLSKPKKHIARDFADGVLMAEIIKHYFPKLVELHNFQAVMGSSARKKNWQTLNFRVFKRLNFELSDEVISSIVACKPGTIERVLLLLRTKIDRNLLSGSNPAAVVPTVKNAELNAGYFPTQTVTLESTPQLAQAAAGFSSTDIVPRLAYDEKVQELMAQDETIKILSMKLNKLEHLLHLKDLRIEELQRKVGDTHTHAGGENAPGARAFHMQPPFAAPPNYGPPGQPFMPPSDQR